MTSVRDLLRDADPLRHESSRLDVARERLRQAVAARALDDAPPRHDRLRSPVALLIAAAVIAAAIVTVSSPIWSRGDVAVHAAVRFEVRLAEDHPAPGLRETPIAGSDRVVYLHQEPIVTNADIARGRVVQGDSASRFGVAVELTEAGGQKMRQATADHVGRPIAILIDGQVVAVPVLRSPVGASALLSGDYSKAEAERIVHGIK